MVLYLSIVLMIILVSRGVAYWAVSLLEGADIPLITDVLYLSYVENRGAAFGIFQNAKVFLIGVSILLFLLITYYVVSKGKSLKKHLLIPLGMIAGGGISNVADRFSFGFVVDYIDFRLIHYPVFNLADICVVVGVFWVAFCILKDTKKQ